MSRSRSRMSGQLPREGSHIVRELPRPHVKVGGRGREAFAFAEAYLYRAWISSASC